MVQTSDIEVDMVDQLVDGWRRTSSLGFQVGILVENEIVRNGLATMLNSLAMVDEVHTWESPLKFPNGSMREFDVLVLALAGVEHQIADRIAREAWRHGKKVVLLVSPGQDEALDTVVGIPSDGFLVQDELTSGALGEVLVRVADGDTPMPRAMTNRLLARAREDVRRPMQVRPDLTPRERQVLELLVEGLSNKDIAQRLRISQHGVKRLVSNVLAKLNCPNRTMAVATALQDGLV